MVDFLDVNSMFASVPLTSSVRRADLVTER